MESEQVVSRIVDEIRSEGVEFNLDDPFDDPSLCTTAFLDITWQDEHGNSALMLAAAENRVLQVKGILTMAINSGKLWQVIDMRNQEGLNCVDMAVRAGSELCAMLITKIAREYAKHKPRPKLENVLVSDVDLEDELDKKNVEQLDDNYLKNLVRDSATTSCHAKKLSRDKISNSLSKSAVGHDYLRMVKRSRSAHLRLLSQNTFSIESDSVDSSEPSTPQLPQPPADHGVFSSVGERIRSIFNKKPPIHSKSLITVPSARSTTPPQAIRSSSLASKPLSYQQTTSIEEDHIRLPQHSSTSPLADNTSGIFRGFKDRPINTVSTANGVRLPPLSLRRRASSDPRSRNFSSLGDEF